MKIIYMLNSLFYSIKWLILILIINTTNLFGQDINVNQCNFEFNLKIEKQDSIPLKNKSGKIIKYWAQSEFEYLTSYIIIDSSSAETSRIKSAHEVIINYGESFYNKTQLDSFNETIEGLWVSNNYLKTDFAGWVFRENRWSLNNEVNPNNENYFYIYSKPSTKSNKKLLDINDFFENVNDTTLYKIKVLECKGRWSKIKISLNNIEVKGWMPWYNFCNNILTTCIGTNPKSGVDNEE